MIAPTNHITPMMIIGRPIGQTKIEEMLRTLVDRGISVDFGSMVLIAIVCTASAFLGAYVKRKGENFATKNDVADITRKQEEVRVEYARQLESIAQQNRELIEQGKQRHQLRMAALDRRLATHQEAYTLWRRLLASVHEKDVGKVILECQDWWDRNSLFLARDARQAFLAAYTTASGHSTVVLSREQKAIGKSWSIITEAGDAIVRGAELPSLGELEYTENRSVSPDKQEASASNGLSDGTDEQTEKPR